MARSTESIRARWMDRCGERCWDSRARSCGIDARIESAGDDAGGNLRAAVEQSESGGTRIRAARNGYRPQRRGVDGADQRTFCQLRSAQVQGAAERADGDGAAVSRKAGRCIRSRGRRSRARSRAARMRTITTGSISSTRSGWGRTSRSRRAMRRIRCWRWFRTPGSS